MRARVLLWLHRGHQNCERERQQSRKFIIATIYSFRLETCHGVNHFSDNRRRFLETTIIYHIGTRSRSLSTQLECSTTLNDLKLLPCAQKIQFLKAQITSVWFNLNCSHRWNKPSCTLENEPTNSCAFVYSFCCYDTYWLYDIGSIQRNTCDASKD